MGKVFLCFQLLNRGSKQKQSTTSVSVKDDKKKAEYHVVKV